MPITTKVMSSNPAHGEMYSIQHYVITFVSDLRRVGGSLRRVLLFFSINKTELHDITEILLKVALHTITLTLNNSKSVIDVEKVQYKIHHTHCIHFGNLATVVVIGSFYFSEFLIISISCLCDSIVILTIARSISRLSPLVTGVTGQFGSLVLVTHRSPLTTKIRGVTSNKLPVR